CPFASRLSPALIAPPSALLLSLCSFLLYCSGDHRDLHSFPTRRSSDLHIHADVFLFPKLPFSPDRNKPPSVHDIVHNTEARLLRCNPPWFFLPAASCSLLFLLPSCS